MTPPSAAAPARAGGPSRLWTILCKELREIFRDRRTLLSVILGPLLVTPGLLWISGIGATRQIEKARTQTYSIGVVGAPSAPTVVAALRAAPHLRVESIALPEAEPRIQSRRLHAVVVLPAGADAVLRSERRAVPVEILHDAGDQNSRSAAGRLDAVFDGIGRRVTEQRLRERNLPPDFVTPFRVTEKPIARGGSATMLLLSGMLPYILILSAFSGAIYAAFDQVAGEKERGTLETLLVSAASRRDIVLGKFGAVVAVCVLSSVLSIVGFVVPFVSGLSAFEYLARGEVRLGAATVGVILLVILPLSVLFAGILLAVSTWARNQKEAQTYLGSLFPLVLIPALFSLFLGADVSKLVALVPILNASLIIKQALSGSYDLVFIALAFAASAFYAGIALWLATKLFQKESVLIKA